VINVNAKIVELSMCHIIIFLPLYLFCCQLNSCYLSLSFGVKGQRKKLMIQVAVT